MPCATMSHARGRADVVRESGSAERAVPIRAGPQGPRQVFKLSGRRERERASDSDREEETERARAKEKEKEKRKRKREQENKKEKHSSYILESSAHRIRRPYWQYYIVCASLHIYPFHIYIYIHMYIYIYIYYTICIFMSANLLQFTSAYADQSACTCEAGLDLTQRSRDVCSRGKVSLDMYVSLD